MDASVPINYKIRDYQTGDFENLISLWKQTGIFQPERNDDEKSIDKCNSLGGKLLVMIDLSANRMIGSSWMTTDGRRLYLHHFCILPEYQGKGLGKALGDASLKFINETRLQVKIEVHKENLKAKKLYEKLGFISYTDYDIYMIRKF